LEFNDGGRSKAGFKGFTTDCFCRAVAIGSDRPYKEVYEELIEFAKTERKSKKRSSRSHPRTGFYRETAKRYLISNGWSWVPLMGIGTGCTVHLKEGELPEGVLICSLSKHYTVVDNGVIQDTHDPSRNGTRCVYGYFVKK